MDIQVCASKWSAAGYVVKYVAKFCSGHGGAATQQAERGFDSAIAHAESRGRGPLAAVAPYFNAHVAPGLMSQLEASRILWELPRSLASRSFVTLSLKTDLRAVKCAEVLLRAAARDPAASATRRSALGRYEVRGGGAGPAGMLTRLQRPTRPHPWCAADSRAAVHWPDWLARRSL